MGLAAVVLNVALSIGAPGGVTTGSAADTTREAASDSTKPILLAPVNVAADRNRPGDAAWIPMSVRRLYQDDGAKLLLGDLRITSALPASADLKLYGLPVDQTAREYIWGHRIGGPTTAVFGSRTKVNPDLLRITLHPFLMSHRYRDTNGALELTPELRSNQPIALSLASDAIERRATLSLANRSDAPAPQLEFATSLRQSDVVPLLEAAVPALRVVPRYLDSQTYARLRLGEQTLEGFVLLGRERGYWHETIDGVDAAVFENTRQNLAVVRYVRFLPGDSRLAAGLSAESDHVYSEHRYGEYRDRRQAVSYTVTPRLEYSMQRDALTAWISQLCTKSEPGGLLWQTSVEGGVESRATLGWFTVQPSLAFQELHGDGTIVHGVTARAHPGPLVLTTGYGTYVDYFVFQDGFFGNVFDPGAAQRPQVATHWVASAQYTPNRRWPFDLLEVTGVRKDLEVDLWGSRNAVRLLSWDGMIARSGNPSWELAFLTNHAQGNNGPLVGVIPVSLRAGISADVSRSLQVSLEGNYRHGSIAEYKAPGPRHGERFRLDPSCYLNVALSKAFEILDRPTTLTVTVFNVLAAAGSRAELTVDEFGRSHTAPCWANVRLRYDLW